MTLDLKKENTLKLFVFIVRPLGVNINIEEDVKLLWAYNLEEVIAEISKRHPNKNCKIIGNKEYTEMQKFLEVVKKPLPEFIVKEEKKTIRNIKAQIAHNIEFLLKDKLTQEIRKKLTKTDLNNLQRILKKI